jgi:hypothetical protein
MFVAGKGLVDIPATAFTSKGLARLAALTELTELRLVSNKLGDSDMATVGKLTGLKKLVVLAPEVTDRGINELKDLKKVEVLDLRGTQLTTASAKTLRGLPRLRVLTTSLMEFDARSRAKLAEWKRLLPRVTIRPAYTLPAGMNFGGFGFGGRLK